MIFQWIVFALIVVVLFLRARLVVRNDAFLDKETTLTVNGFFICVVFLVHFAQYCRDYYPNSVASVIRQLVVVSFLFYSGYGCAVQYRCKGESYLKTFPRKRILATLVNFDMAVCLFIIVGFLLGKSFPLRQIVLSFIGWDAVGNSAWYIFAILLCYMAFWASFKFLGRFPPMARALSCVVLVAMFILVLSRVKDPFWYSTMMVFPTGVVFGLYKGRCEKFLARNYWPCLAVLVILVAVAEHLPVIGTRHWASFNLKSVCFAILLVMATMKVELHSPPLRWCGEHLFPLYIYQRIPMIVFSTLHPAAFQDWRSWLYCALSFCFTVFIASQYRRFHFK